MQSAIYINSHKLEMDYHQFNGGERNVKIKQSWLNGMYYQPTLTGSRCVNDKLNYCKVYALLFDSQSIMDLLLVCDAIRGEGVKNIDLTIPYIPYARQDRRCVKGEAHSLKVFANLINSIGARTVTVYDPHSDVCEALINNIKINPQHIPILDSALMLAHSYDVIISPDGGAIKKCTKLVTSLNYKRENDFVRMESAQKKRNLQTGKIEKVFFNPICGIDGVDEKRCCVVDDLCDKGMSFFYLGKEILGTYTPEALDLYVTHGLFIDGTKKLYEIFDNIYTLDYTNPKDIKVIRLEEF